MRRERLPPGGRQRVLCLTTIPAVPLRVLGESICSGAVVHKPRWPPGTCSIRASYFFCSNAHRRICPPKTHEGEVVSAGDEAASSWQKYVGRACISPTRPQEMDSRWSWHLGRRGSGAHTYLSWVNCAGRSCIQVMT